MLLFRHFLSSGVLVATLREKVQRVIPNHRICVVFRKMNHRICVDLYKGKGRICVFFLLFYHQICAFLRIINCVCDI